MVSSTDLPGRNVPVHDPPEDGDHGVIIKLVNGDHVEVSEETRGDRIPATARGTHGGHNLDVNQLHGRGFLEVVPVPVIQPLSEQLNRRLSSKLLQHGHIQIIHKHNLQANKHKQNILLKFDKFLIIIDLHMI